MANWIQCPICKSQLHFFEVFDHPCRPGWYWDLREGPLKTSDPVMVRGNSQRPVETRKQAAIQSHGGQQTWKFGG